MIAVALWVASLPGAVGRMRGVRHRAAAARHRRAGACSACCDRRCAGAARVLVVVASAVGGRARRCRTCSSRPTATLSRCAAPTAGSPIHRTGSDTFAVREWLAADADARAPNDRRCGEGFALRRDRLHRAGSPTARLVARRSRAEAFEEDCRRAALVVSQRDAPPACAATGDRPQGLARARGAMALRRDGDGLRDDGGAAAGLRPALGARAAAVAASETAQRRPTPRDRSRAMRRRATRRSATPDD